MDHMPGGSKFIRSVNFESSPSCVIATDAQLQNVVRFCTNQGIHCILGIDPTFNLSKFYVTITTFVYTHVVKKGTMEAPTFFGPMFIYIKKVLNLIITSFQLSKNGAKISKHHCCRY